MAFSKVRTFSKVGARKFGFWEKHQQGENIFEQNSQISRIDEMYKSVRRFADLGTGRKSRKVVVGDSPDARTATFRFVGNIHHNWPSWNEVGIRTEDGRTKLFYTKTQTVNGNPAHIFFWNELTANLWLEQVERQKLLKWFEVGIQEKPRDSITMMELVVELTGSKYPIERYPDAAGVNLKQFQIELRKLNLSALQELNQIVNGVAEPEKRV